MIRVKSTDVLAAKRLDSAQFLNLSSEETSAPSGPTVETHRASLLLDNIQKEALRASFAQASIGSNCEVCSCKSFEPNIWRPGLCRSCYHNHIAPLPSSPRGTQSSKVAAQSTPLNSSGPQSVSSAMDSATQRVTRRGANKRVNQATEFISRHILDSKLVETCMTSIVRQAEDQTDDSYRHLVANILLREDYEEQIGRSAVAMVEELQKRKRAEEDKREYEIKLAQRESELIAREIALLTAAKDPEAAKKIKALTEQEEHLKKKRTEIQAAKDNVVEDDKAAQKRRRKAAREAREKARNDSKGLEELLTKEMVQAAEGFLKTSEQPASLDLGWGSLDYPENDVFYYRDNFMIHPQEYMEIEKAKKHFNVGRFVRILPEDFKVHINIFAVHESSEKLIISISRNPDEFENFIGIVRSKLGDQPFSFPAALAKGKGTKDVIMAMKRHFPVLNSMALHYSLSHPEAVEKRATLILGHESKPASSKYLPAELLDLDRKLKVQNYKFGVLYVKPTQTADDIFSNGTNSSLLDGSVVVLTLGVDIGSPEFEDFIDQLGNRIALKGWRGYKADLDVKESTTGTHSVYTEWEDLEIMFHVSTLLPPDTRPRLLGNDIVVIVYYDGLGSWNPNNLTSQVMHGQIVVQPVRDSSGTAQYKVETAIRDGVPGTRPAISHRQLFDLNEDFRDILLRKLVNVERGSWHCPKKVRSQKRSLLEHLGATRQGQLDYLYERHVEGCKPLKQ